MFDARLDRRLFLGGGAAALALPTRAWPLSPRPPTPFAAVSTLFRSYVADDRLPGAAGAIGLGTGEAVFLSEGKQGREQSASMSADSLFRVYSMTKPVTGIAAMMLIEDGKIGLDQNVGDFIPSFRKPRVLTDPERSLAARPAVRPVTVRNLMTHTAGLGYAIVSKGPLLAEFIRLGLLSGVASRMPLPGQPDITPAPSLEAFADRIGTLPLIADPGTRWSYSAGLDVLGRVIEVASGTSFAQFLNARLFEPLGMTSSFFQVPKSELGRMTTNYGILPGRKVPIDAGATTIFADPPPFAMGGAGLVMSARDYDRFLRMLAGQGAIGDVRVIKPETARLAMSNLLPPGAVTAGTYAAGQGFGAGGRVTIAADPRGAGVGTFGWAGAAATIGWVDPTRGVRASGFAQYVPDTSMPFTTDFGKAVYASL